MDDELSKIRKKVTKDELAKVREKAIHDFIDSVYNYCDNYGLTFIYELLFLLRFMISKANETLFEGVEDDE